MRSLAGDIRGRVFTEHELGAVAAAARAAIGDGPTGAQGRELRSVELAPYAALATGLPLAFLLWRRNLR